MATEIAQPAVVLDGAGRSVGLEDVDVDGLWVNAGFGTTPTSLFETAHAHDDVLEGALHALAQNVKDAKDSSAENTAQLTEHAAQIEHNTEQIAQLGGSPRPVAKKGPPPATADDLRQIQSQLSELAAFREEQSQLMSEVQQAVALLRPPALKDRPRVGPVASAAVEVRAADEDAESELAELRMRLAEQERINAEQGAVLEQLMEEIREGGGPVPGNWINYDASAKPLSAKPSSRGQSSRGGSRGQMSSRDGSSIQSRGSSPSVSRGSSSRGGRSAGGMMPDLSEMPEMPGVEPQDDGDDIYEAERSPARTTRVPSRGEPAGAAVSAPRRTKSPHDGGYSTAAKPPVSPAAAASSGGSRAPSAPAPAPAPPPSGGAVAIDPPAARTVEREAKAESAQPSSERAHRSEKKKSSSSGGGKSKSSSSKSSSSKSSSSKSKSKSSSGSKSSSSGKAQESSGQRASRADPSADLAEEAAAEASSQAAAVAIMGDSLKAQLAAINEELNSQQHRLGALESGDQAALPYQPPPAAAPAPSTPGGAAKEPARRGSPNTPQRPPAGETMAQALQRLEHDVAMLKGKQARAVTPWGTGSALPPGTPLSQEIVSVGKAEAAVSAAIASGDPVAAATAEASLARSRSAAAEAALEEAVIAGDTEAIEAAEAQVQQERTQVEEAEAVAVAAESRGVSPDFGSRQGLGSTTSDLGVALAPSNTSGEMALLKLERFTTEMSESIKEETATREAALKQCTATLSSLKEQVGGLHKSLDAAGEQLRDKAEQHSISKLEVALTEAMDLIGLLARRSGGQAQVAVELQEHERTYMAEILEEHSAQLNALLSGGTEDVQTAAELVAEMDKKLAAEMESRAGELMSKLADTQAQMEGSAASLERTVSGKADASWMGALEEKIRAELSATVSGDAQQSRRLKRQLKALSTKLEAMGGAAMRESGSWRSYNAIFNRCLACNRPLDGSGSTWQGGESLPPTSSASVKQRDGPESNRIKMKEDPAEVIMKGGFPMANPKAKAKAKAKKAKEKAKNSGLTASQSSMSIGGMGAS